MKKHLFFAMAAFCTFHGFSAPPSAEKILQFVRERLPVEPLKLTGTLKSRTRNGFTRTVLPVTIDLDWGADPPAAAYRIAGESLLITWRNGEAEYQFSEAGNTPFSHIPGTEITWADLSFSVLWWPNPRLAGEEKKIHRESYILEVPVPDSEQTMRLWIEKKMGLLLEIRTLDKNGRPLRRLKIRSIKKMEGLWMAKDLELKDEKSGYKTTLQVTELKRRLP